jgi:hypothetical protein
MQKFGAARCWAATVMAVLTLAGPAIAEPAPKSQIVAGVSSVLAPMEKTRDGVLTVYDGNMFVQCLASHRLPNWRCEAAGLEGEPWLRHVLTPERQARLIALGFKPDPSFGNFVADIPKTTAPEALADLILRALIEGYGATPDALNIRAERIESARCHKRIKSGADRGGSILTPNWGYAKDAVVGCGTPGPDHMNYDDPASTMPQPDGRDTRSVYLIYMAEELKRLESVKNSYVIFEAGPAYVQCMNDDEDRKIYCEAASADAVGAPIERILTPDRIAKLYAAGFKPPGKTMNYARFYPQADYTKAAIAQALLDVLKDAYGYYGAPKMNLETEQGVKRALLPE